MKSHAPDQYSTQPSNVFLQQSPDHLNNDGPLSQIAESYDNEKINGSKPYSAASGVRNANQKTDAAYSNPGSSVNNRQMRRGTAHEMSSNVYKSKLNFNAYSSGANSKMKLPPPMSQNQHYQTHYQGVSGTKSANKKFLPLRDQGKLIIPQPRSQNNLKQAASMSQGRIGSPSHHENYQSQIVIKKQGGKRNGGAFQHIPRSLRTGNTKMNKSENNIHGGPIQVVDEVHILASNDE
jgi:hypothetical protein